MDFKQYIREVPDFPREGILFYDITTLLEKPEIFAKLVNEMTNRVKDLGATKIIGIESRGFIFGAPIALNMGLPFIPMRKPGKLPYKTIKHEYKLEYGIDAIEVHVDALNSNDKVVLVDDLLATGGTIEAAANLCNKCGASVAAMLFAIELDFLQGKEKLKNYRVESIVSY